MHRMTFNTNLFQEKNKCSQKLIPIRYVFYKLHAMSNKIVVAHKVNVNDNEEEVSAFYTHCC